MTVVYDVEHGRATWELFAAGAAALALGLAICLTFRGRLGTTKTNAGVMPSWIFYGLMTALGSCILGGIAADGWSSDRELRAHVRSGACQQVEGLVEALSVSGYENHERVAFVVGGRSFRYGTNSLHGMTDLPEHGVPFGNGTRASILACPSIDPNSSTIARFETR